LPGCSKYERENKQVALQPANQAEAHAAMQHGDIYLPAQPTKPLQPVMNIDPYRYNANALPI